MLPDKKIPLVLVDLSWVMYTNLYAMRSLCICDPQGNTKPTGHIYGAVKNIISLATQADYVLICVDSSATLRKQLLSTYKAGRKERDDYYDVHQDTRDILKLTTCFKSVWFLQTPELEADDILSSLIQQYHFRKMGIIPTIYGTDNDLLQTPAHFNVIKSSLMGVEPVDVKAYLTEKYGIKLPWLPIWYKVLHGDAGDGIPNIIPRTDLATVAAIAMDNQDHQDIDKFYAYMKTRRSSIWHKFKDLEQKIGTNYKLVCPMYRTLEELGSPLKLTTTPQEVWDLLRYYQLDSLQAYYR